MIAVMPCIRRFASSRVEPSEPSLLILLILAFGMLGLCPLCAGLPSWVSVQLGLRCAVCGVEVALLIFRVPFLFGYMRMQGCGFRCF